jgi:two-component system, chemotaxis family, sensor kinase CheA
MAQDPYRYFRPEARNLLEQFAQGILDLEKSGGGAGAVQRLLRLAHTLKGAARVVRQSGIAERAHAIEDALEPFRECADGIARENIDSILAHLDEINGQIVTLVPDGPGAAPDPGTVAPQAPSVRAPADAARDAQRVIRADLAEMDALLDGVSETHTRLNGLRRSGETVEQLGHLADLLRAQITARMPIEQGHASAHDGGTPAAATAEELRRKISGLARELDATIAQMDRELRQLRDAAEGLRLVPVDNVLMALNRIARDSAHALGKQVNFESTGGDIRLDAEAPSVMQGALVQIVRNAVAHGIETESERVAAGKSPAGRMTVNVSRRGSKLLFECRDDGRGIDLAAIRKTAVERGLISATAGELNADAILGILLRGGVSTSAAVTDVSGRGVGLDIVREATERLGGEVSVRSEAGHGTTFDLLIPRSITSLAVLVVETKSGNSVAIPLSSVRRIVRLTGSDIACAVTGASVIHEGQAIPFMPLAAALDAERWSARRGWTALIVAGAERIAAVGVEQLVGTARAVVRPLPDRLKVSPVVAGAALDGEGNPQLVLDPDGLVSAAHAMQGVEAGATVAKRPVLVVDDSLTTRMLEKSILESAGYEVDVASSGEEGLALARNKRFSLILCDVEMPGIDGFTFVARVRSDPALRDIPAILVTSRAAPEDRQRGRDAGAHGYVVKSEFNQAELLAMIGPLVG